MLPYLGSLLRFCISGLLFGSLYPYKHLKVKFSFSNILISLSSNSAATAIVIIIPALLLAM